MDFSDFRFDVLFNRNKCFFRFRDICLPFTQTGERISIYNKGLIFRHIQVLASMLNEIQSGAAILLILCIPTIIIAMVALTLVQGSNTDFVFVATLIVLLIDCFLVIMALFGQMSTLCEKSSEILNKMLMKRYSAKLSRGQKWEQRFYKSCSPIKVMISSGAYVDALTPLNCLHLSMTLSANMLLLNKSNL